MKLAQKSLLILLSTSAHAFGAEQAHDKKPEEVIVGALRVIGSVKSAKKLAEDTPWHTSTLEKVYGKLDANEPLIRVDYSSPQASDWTDSRLTHPQLRGKNFITDYLPVLKRIATSKTYAPVEKMNAEIAQLLFFPPGVGKIIAEYAEDLRSLLECSQGDLIMITLPIDGFKQKAQLQCFGYYGNYNQHLRTSLILTKNIISPELRKKLEAEEERAELEKLIN